MRERWHSAIVCRARGTSSSEFGVDHRLILAAYKQLAAEGLVEVRERGGVYVSGAHVSTTGFGSCR